MTVPAAVLNSVPLAGPFIQRPNFQVPALRLLNTPDALTAKYSPSVVVVNDGATTPPFTVLPPFLPHTASSPPTRVPESLAPIKTVPVTSTLIDLDVTFSLAVWLTNWNPDPDGVAPKDWPNPERAMTVPLAGAECGRAAARAPGTAMAPITTAPRINETMPAESRDASWPA